jgi:hypothetical protein
MVQLTIPYFSHSSNCTVSHTRCFSIHESRCNFNVLYEMYTVYVAKLARSLNEVVPQTDGGEKLNAFTISGELQT